MYPKRERPGVDWVGVLDELRLADGDATYVQLNSDNSEMVQDLKRITFDEVNAVLQMVGLNPTPDALGTILNDCKLICPISLKNLVRVSARAP